MAGIYLTRKHFGYMVAAAIVVHIAGAVVWAAGAGQHITKIPVNVLNIKLGAGEMIAAPNMGNPGNVPQAREASEVSLPSYVPPPRENARVQQATEAETAKDAATVAKNATSAVEQPSVAQASAPAAPAPGKALDYKTQAAPVTTQSGPSQYVRGMGSPDGVAGGAPIGTSTAAQEEIIRRYEQLISIWIQQHKMYPKSAKDQGVQGSALVRIRIDRQGNIKYFKMEQSTGYSILDDAIVAMVRAADPVPPVPANYPAGNLIEFLIPVSYKLR